MLPLSSAKDTFLNHLFNIPGQAQTRHHFVHLNAGVKVDLLWWKYFLNCWKGVMFVLRQPAPVVPVCLAAARTGCACVHPCHGSISIGQPPGPEWTLWSRSWSQVYLHTDNMAVVAILKSHIGRSPMVLHLLWCFISILHTNSLIMSHSIFQAYWITQLTQSPVSTLIVCFSHFTGSSNHCTSSSGINVSHSPVGLGSSNWMTQFMDTLLPQYPSPQ